MAAMRKISNDAVACQDWNNNWKEEDDKFMFMHCGPHDTSWLKPGTYVDTHRILDNTFGKNTGYGCIQGRFIPTLFTYGSCSSEDGVLKFYIGTGEITEDKLPENYFGSGGAAVIIGRRFYRKGPPFGPAVGHNSPIRSRNQVPCLPPGHRFLPVLCRVV